jgi:hypothetical protein
MDCKVAALTTNGVDPVTPSSVALMLAVPAATPVATPTLPDELLTVAAAVLSEAQVTSLVMCWLVESLKMPVAVKLPTLPGAMAWPVGVTKIDATFALVTTRLMELPIDPSVAPIVVEPGASPSAFPTETVATAGWDEDHTTWLVMLRVPPSLKRPVAVKRTDVFSAMVESPGVIVIDDKLATSTVAKVLPLTDPEVAVTVALPMFFAVAKPLGVSDITEVLEEFQETVRVMSCMVPSEKLPVAVNCCKVPRGTSGFEGVTVMDRKVAPVTVNVALPTMLPDVAWMVEVPGASAVARPCVPGELLIVATLVETELHVADDVRFLLLLSL